MRSCAVFEIGNSLREARTRRPVDFNQAELATKIRVKYLRALEDERFDQLPSQTYVKGFLRTYAEYLGLDGQLYVDEFNSRFVAGDDHDRGRAARRSVPSAEPAGSRRHRPARRRRGRARDARRAARGSPPVGLEGAEGDANARRRAEDAPRGRVPYLQIQAVTRLRTSPSTARPTGRLLFQGTIDEGPDRAVQRASASG